MGESSRDTLARNKFHSLLENATQSVHIHFLNLSNSKYFQHWKNKIPSQQLKIYTSVPLNQAQGQREPI